MDYDNSGWVTNGNRFTTSYAYFGAVDQWPSTNKETAVQPDDLPKAKLVDSKVIMNDQVWYHTGRAVWFYNHGLNGSAGSPNQTQLAASGTNELYTDGHVEWLPLSSSDLAKMVARTYTRVVYQTAGKNYPFFY